MKEALYRIAQEGLYNAVRHAQARRVTVRLKEGDRSIVLEVQDDGIGFDPEQEYLGHMGLHSMRERVDRLGGSLNIESSPGRGTLLRASDSFVTISPAGRPMGCDGLIVTTSAEPGYVQHTSVS